MQYARAFQTGAWDDIIAMTWWMQERLERVALRSSDPAEGERARQRLRAHLSRRAVAGNQLRPEGIEDQYVFAPGGELTAVSTDTGRETLAKPVSQRTWIRVTYPEPARALRDEEGNTIRSILVGVNVSQEGFVLKANVIGNLDIRKESYRYMWSEQGTSE